LSPADPTGVFACMVAADTRGRSPESELPRSQERREEWYAALKALHADLEAQFAERKAASQRMHNDCLAKGPAGKAEWFEHKAGFDAWRTAARRFKASVEARLVEAWSLISRDRRALAERRRAERDASAGERLRGPMRRAREFLGRDSNLSPAALGARDGPVKELDRALADLPPLQAADAGVGGSPAL